jgi:pilus assembly protein CpaC
MTGSFRNEGGEIMNKQGIWPRGLMRIGVCVVSVAHVATAVAQTTAATTAPVAPTAPAAPAASDANNNGYAQVLKPTRPARTPTAGRAASVYAPIQSVSDDGQIAEIEMFVGESRVFPAPGVARIAVGNGSLLTAAALDGKEVILFANSVGTSSLFIWNADGRYQRVKINIVPGDTSRYAREIAAFLSTIPRTKASIVGANIIVEGDQLADGDLQKIEELAKRYPQIVNFTNRVGWEQMVAVDVKVVEFPTSVLREMGIKWTGTGGAAVGGIWSPGRRGDDGPFQIAIRAGEGNAPPISSPDGAVLLPRGLNVLSALNMGINGQLSLLAQEGKAAILAEPQLSARHGASAKFVAGGEIPYAVQTRDGIVIAYKEYGVKLDIKPLVDPQGAIRAAIKTEVSSVDRSITAQGGPALLTRKTETEFNVRGGETIVLAGLLQRESSTDVDKLPFLGDIPVLGALFRSKRFVNKETELVVFVTPTVVTPRSPGVADRVERATERLQERFGPKPFLTEPLQPGADSARPDLAPPKSSSSSAPTDAPATVPAATPVPVTPATPKPFRVADSAVERSDDGALLSVVVDGAALRPRPSLDAAPSLTLQRGATVVLGNAEASSNVAGQWKNVKVGSVVGWLLAADVRPLHQTGTPPDTLVDTGRPVRQPVPQGMVPKPVVLRPIDGPSAVPAKEFRVHAKQLALRLTPDVNADVITTFARGDVVRSVPGATSGSWVGVASSDQSDRWGWVPAQWLVPLTSPRNPSQHTP